MSILTRSTIAAAVLATAATGALVGGGAAPASAGNCSTIAGVLQCGGVKNASSSPKDIAYTMNWNPNGGQVTSGWLKPGQSKGGRGTGVDVDGYYIPTGCVGYGGTSTSGQTQGWYKIADITNATITLYC